MHQLVLRWCNRILHREAKRQLNSQQQEQQKSNVVIKNVENLIGEIGKSKDEQATEQANECRKGERSKPASELTHSC